MLRNLIRRSHMRSLCQQRMELSILEATLEQQTWANQEKEADDSEFIQEDMKIQLGAGTFNLYQSCSATAFLKCQYMAEQPTIFEAYNFFIKNCLHLSICACHPAGGPMLPPSSACSRRLKVTITSIRGKGSAGHARRRGGPPYKHSLSQRPTRVTY